MTALKITQVRGTVGARWKQRETLRTLGLKKIRQSVVREDNPQTRGLIRVVHHLVEGRLDIRCRHEAVRRVVDIRGRMPASRSTASAKEDPIASPSNPSALASVRMTSRPASIISSGPRPAAATYVPASSISPSPCFRSRTAALMSFPLIPVPGRFPYPARHHDSVRHAGGSMACTPESRLC